jgi:hypothetical protein
MRKDASPSVTEVSTENFQVYSKRPKITHTTHMSGEEEPHSSKVVEKKHQVVSTSSSKKKNDIVVTTQTPQGSIPLNIFEKYDLMKKKNQMMTNNTYAQFWKQTSTTQHILLSSFDIEKGIMHLDFLQAQVPQPKEITDYKRSTIFFDTKQVHLDNQMDLHRQIGEMVFSILSHASSTTVKL